MVTIEDIKRDFLKEREKVKVQEKKPEEIHFDPGSPMETGLYLGCVGRDHVRFLYNVSKLRQYLKETGKELSDLTYAEMKQFKVA